MEQENEREPNWTAQFFVYKNSGFQFPTSINYERKIILVTTTVFID